MIKCEHCDAYYRLSIEDFNSAEENKRICVIDSKKRVLEILVELFAAGCTTLRVHLKCMIAILPVLQLILYASIRAKV